jgi:Zn-finger nucleic acid-binding protein
MKRLGILAAMARKTPQAIVEEVRESDKAREQARGVLHSFEEIKKRQLELFPHAGDDLTTAASQAGAAPMTQALEGASPGSGPACPETAALPPDESRIWLLTSLDPHKWEGPFTMSELLCHPRFSLIMTVKNIQEGVLGKAREFPQVRIALQNVAHHKPIDPARQNLCPRCHVPLVEAFYEGVALRLCRKCLGKLVDMSTIDRIIARREVTFSNDLLAKARAFQESVLLNPIKKQKINTAIGDEIPCPNCGYRMVPRPYNYQYFIPVDKCLSCSKIWFDSDELEILQIIIEEHRT